MASQTRGSPPHLDTNLNVGLIDALVKEGHAFSFFQIIRLLRLYISKSMGKPKSTVFSGDTLQIKPKLTLAFPASDVESVQKLGDLDNPRFLILANFSPIILYEERRIIIVSKSSILSIADQWLYMQYENWL